MPDYDARFLAMASRMLAPKPRGKGQTVTVHQPATDGSFDPATDTVIAPTPPVDHTGSGVEDRYSAFALTTGAVEAGDVRFLLSPLKADGSPMPEPVADAWSITQGGKRWTIKRVERIAPAGVAVLYDLTLRLS